MNDAERNKNEFYAFLVREGLLFTFTELFRFDSFTQNNHPINYMHRLGRTAAINNKINDGRIMDLCYEWEKIVISRGLRNKVTCAIPKKFELNTNRGAVVTKGWISHAYEKRME